MRLQCGLKRHRHEWFQIVGLAKRAVMAMRKSRRKTPKCRGSRGASGAGRSRAEIQVKRDRMSVINLPAPGDEVEYWRSRSPAERLAYVEDLRLINYGQ